MPSPDEVLLSCELVSVNHVDTFVRSRAYRNTIPAPLIIGRDVVGTVEELGNKSKVSSADKGPRASQWATTGIRDTHPNLLSSPTNRLFHLPDTVSEPLDVVATAHSLTTVQLAFTHAPNLGPDKCIFIGGTAGNVSTVAVQCAHSMGSRVIASGPAADHNWIWSLRADQALDCRDPHLPQKASAQSPDGIYIWWDASGHLILSQATDSVAHAGNIHLSTGIDKHSNLQVETIYTRDISIHGFAVFNASDIQLRSAALGLNEFLKRGSLRYRRTAEFFPGPDHTSPPARRIGRCSRQGNHKRARMIIYLGSSAEAHRESSSYQSSATLAAAMP
ncbi:alcohol dehydrogenase catalytic domain-containing protein [Glutamicibacter sp.]|uniref:alcohol dehydrogenase catalytic domain-containing protein n=1 Tax=Glutamicibacter sp. TaxID=1931995 RepID=UPI0037C066DF